MMWLSKDTQIHQVLLNNLLHQGMWTVVKATVVGSHVIPDFVAMHVPVSVQSARVGSDICKEGSSQHKNGKDNEWKPHFVLCERHKINGFC